jgi:hypothetical protein
MKAVTVYVVLRVTFFAVAEKIRSFSLIFGEGLCFFGTTILCFANLRD